MQLKIYDYDDIVIEWIPYNQFNNIEERVKYDFTIVSLAQWKGGPLYWSEKNTKYIRDSYKTVNLKCLKNSQNITNEFLNEV